MGKTRSKKNYTPKKYGKSTLDFADDSGIEPLPIGLSDDPSNSLPDAGLHVHFAPLDDSGFITEDESPPSSFYVQPKYTISKHIEDEKEFDLMSWVALTVFIICCVFTIFTFALPQPFERLKVTETTEEFYLEWQGAKRLSLIGFVWAAGLSVVLGLTCTCFSWTFMYFDSHKPGRLPPTPLSPKKYRDLTGHTFHLSYVMSLLNGATLCVYALWRLKDSYLFQR